MIVCVPIGFAATGAISESLFQAVNFGGPWRYFVPFWIGLVIITGLAFLLYQPIIWINGIVPPLVTRVADRVLGRFGPMRQINVSRFLMSLGYLLTNNPATALFSHIAMHIAGVLHGPASVVQLPPHY